MHRPQSRKPITNRQGPPSSLTDNDITTVRVDRRSFLSRAVAVGSVAVGAAVTTGCPGGTDSDSDSQETDSDSNGSNSQ